MERDRGARRAGRARERGPPRRSRGRARSGRGRAGPGDRPAHGAHPGRRRAHRAGLRRAAVRGRAPRRARGRAPGRQGLARGRRAGARGLLPRRRGRGPRARRARREGHALGRNGLERDGGPGAVRTRAPAGHPRGRGEEGELAEGVAGRRQRRLHRARAASARSRLPGRRAPRLPEGARRSSACGAGARGRPRAFPRVLAAARAPAHADARGARHRGPRGRVRGAPRERTARAGRALVRGLRGARDGRVLPARRQSRRGRGGLRARHRALRAEHRREPGEQGQLRPLRGPGPGRARAPGLRARRPRACHGRPRRGLRAQARGRGHAGRAQPLGRGHGQDAARAPARARRGRARRAGADGAPGARSGDAGAAGLRARGPAGGGGVWGLRGCAPPGSWAGGGLSLERSAGARVPRAPPSPTPRGATRSLEPALRSPSHPSSAAKDRLDSVSRAEPRALAAYPDPPTSAPGGPALSCPARRAYGARSTRPLPPREAQ